jgi:chromosome segregation ATPase
VWKNRIVSFAIGVALGVLGTAGAVLVGQSGDSGELAQLDRANQRQTAETVAGLERTVGEQRDRITELEESNSNLRASNQKLESNNRDARGIVEQLTVSTGTEATDIRSAIALHETIKDQIDRLDRVLGGGDTGGGGSGGMGGMDAGGEVAEP